MSLRKFNFKNFTVSDHAVVMVLGTTKDEAKYGPNQDPLSRRRRLPRGQDFPQVAGVVKTANDQTRGKTTPMDSLCQNQDVIHPQPRCRPR
jgi:hypothetical protein